MAVVKQEKSREYEYFKDVFPVKLLEVLMAHSSIERALTVAEVTDFVNKKFLKDFNGHPDESFKAKMVKRHLEKLESGGCIECIEKIVPANGKKKETTEEYYYCEQGFTDAELRFLIDGLLVSKHIPHKKCEALIKKLEGLGSESISGNVNNIRNLPVNMPDNPEMFVNIKMLDEAISQNKQVEFTYNDFNEKGKLVPRAFNNNGNVKKYVVNPYQMVASNNRYYLICNFEKYSNFGCTGNVNYSNLSYYRIDRISDVKVMDTFAKKRNELSEEINIPTHMAEHIYMFSGKSDRVRMRVDVNLISDVIDWFGKDVSFFNKTENSILASVVVNLQAMRYWAMQYANSVEVLHPQELREQIKKDLLAAVEKYKD